MNEVEVRIDPGCMPCPCYTIVNTCGGGSIAYRRRDQFCCSKTMIYSTVHPNPCGHAAGQCRGGTNSNPAPAGRDCNRRKWLASVVYSNKYLGATVVDRCSEERRRRSTILRTTLLVVTECTLLYVLYVLHVPPFSYVHYTTCHYAVTVYCRYSPVITNRTSIRPERRTKTRTGQVLTNSRHLSTAPMPEQHQWPASCFALERGLCCT